jgi:hypothetical protein
MKHIVSRDQVLKLALKEMKENNWRYGQALYNATYVYYPDFCDARNGTEDDPFYTEEVLNFVIQKWHHELKVYIEDLLEHREAEQSASNKP